MYTLIHLLPSLFKVKRKVDILQACLDVLVNTKVYKESLSEALPAVNTKQACIPALFRQHI